MGSSNETHAEPLNVFLRLSVAQADAERIRNFLESSFDTFCTGVFEHCPLDEDEGGSFTLDEIYDMSAQEYLLHMLDRAGFSYVDLSPGQEDIFNAQTQVIVNPTNLLGPMGAGLAKAFKEQYPVMADEYRAACKARAQHNGNVLHEAAPNRPGQIISEPNQPIYPGDLWMAPTGQTAPAPQKILCFPTKRDWKDPSDLSLIEEGLKTFVRNYKQLGIKSITFPKLGCGLGGLNWDKDVKPLMKKYLGNLPDLNVQVCGDTLHEDKKEFYMSGAHGMLPTVFDVAAPDKKDKIHQAEKPVELLEQILGFVTLEGETVLDQFAGSGVLGEAALKTGRNSILIEKDPETFEKISNRLKVLGKLEAVTPAAQAVLSIGKDAIVAQDAFNRTGDRGIIYDFVKEHQIPEASVLYEGEKDLRKDASPEQAEAVTKAFEAIEDIDLRSSDLDLSKDSSELHTDNQAVPAGKLDYKVLECSSRGDRRFSALFAMVTIKGKEQSIEQWYQNAKRTTDGKRAGKGKPFAYIIDPYSGDKLPAKDAADLYRGLWITYLSNNPDLVEYALQFDDFSDAFQSKRCELTIEEDMAGLRPDTTFSPADIVGAYVADKERYTACVRASHWYRNLAQKTQKVKKPLSEQMKAASEKKQTMESEQLSMFGYMSSHKQGNLRSGR